MISIRIQNLTKRFGSTVALDDLSLTIEPGELFFLLGASGCGKTTLLRSLAGFVTPEAGRILFGADEVTKLPPHRRNTGMVFQSYALWPHLTVAGNVAFGLEERKVPRPEIRRRVDEALASVRMSAYADRKPNQLSGGQQQRVALARALVVHPSCLLLDEPLSNLDAKLRLEMRAEIRRVCKEFKLTTVYVTHDQKEALSVADRMAILEAGRVLQVGTPAEVYRRPVCKAAAHFIGETDFIDGRVAGIGGGADGTVLVDTPLGRFEGVAGDPSAGGGGGGAIREGAAVTLSIRPEAWVLRDTAAASGVNSVAGRIGGCVYLGEVAQYNFVTQRDGAAGNVLKIYELNPRHFVGGASHAGGQLHAHVAPEDVVVLTR
ncbi:ABC transporter ATP-binding protein [Geminisphaera colitermitum]|uniref:ABC transporter ATP-binding protein n=1 Tax=Geminisphaera colitermitum TaxID=1148786 RepID=UPI0005BB6C13|nr:ABC transporter ATP-binding protein [Geminisphaera colitermitum]